jgi:uncharacterized membrane protein YkoI
MKPLVAVCAVALAVCAIAGAGADARADPTTKPPAHGPNSLGPDWRPQQDEARQGVRTRQLIPITTVIERLHRMSKGRQLDAGLEYQGERPVYRVRWITDQGLRIDYLVDATTGAIISGG